MLSHSLEERRGELCDLYSISQERANRSQEPPFPFSQRWTRKAPGMSLPFGIKPPACQIKGKSSSRPPLSVRCTSPCAHGWRPAAKELRPIVLDGRSLRITLHYIPSHHITSRTKIRISWSTAPMCEAPKSPRVATEARDEGLALQKPASTEVVASGQDSRMTHAA